MALVIQKGSRIRIFFFGKKKGGEDLEGEIPFIHVVKGT